MKFIIATIIIFISALLGVFYMIMKTVGDYDKAEEERMRREIYGYDVPEPEEEEKEDEQM